MYIKTISKLLQAKVWYAVELPYIGQFGFVLYSEVVYFFKLRLIHPYNQCT